MNVSDMVSSNKTYLVEQVWAVERMYELQKTIRSHSENARNVVLDSARKKCQKHLQLPQQ